MSVSRTTWMLVSIAGFIGAGSAVPAGSTAAAPAAGQEALVDAAAPALDCPVELFPDLQAWPGNAAYPDPEVSVSCSGDMMTVRSNGIPGYQYVNITPNGLSAQDHVFQVPRYPELADEATPIPLLGTAGFAVNGMPIFGPNEAAFPDPYGDPVYNSIVDDCLGHTAQRGLYHYHALLVACVLGQDVAGAPDPVIGFANDGFRIYGPEGCADAQCSEVITYRSSWERTGDPSTYAWDNHRFVARSEAGYLDQCNGHVGPLGDYHYHATATFPYILGCSMGSGAAGSVPPTGLKARARSNGRVRLSWSDNADDETGYQIEMSADSDSWGVLAQLARNQRTYVARQLVAGTPYAFRVRAISTGGLSYPSDQATVTAK